jgi:Methyltransferase domain
VTVDERKLSEFGHQTQGEIGRGFSSGIERFFRPGHLADVVLSWIQALAGATAKLERGALIAEVGCGCGGSTIALAQAYPNSGFVGFDSHEPSITQARKAAAAAKVADRVVFELASAASYPGTGYALVTYFGCLSDAGDPIRTAGHVRSTLALDGAWMLVEPSAGDRPPGAISSAGRSLPTGSAASGDPSRPPRRPGALSAYRSVNHRCARSPQLQASLAAGRWPRRRTSRCSTFVLEDDKDPLDVDLVLDEQDAGELFTWLRTLSFVEAGARGLFPHDIVRDVCWIPICAGGTRPPITPAPPCSGSCLRRQPTPVRDGHRAADA